MTGIEIRDFDEADRSAVVGLARQLQAAEFSLDERMKAPGEIGAWYIDHLLEECERDSGKILVATDGEALIGYAVILTAVSSAEEVDETDYHYAHIKDLAVAESHRGRGLGGQLIARAEAIAKDAGARWLRISAMTDNRAAVQLYERRGFKPLLCTLEKTIGDD